MLPLDDASGDAPNPNAPPRHAQGRKSSWDCVMTSVHDERGEGIHGERPDSLLERDRLPSPPKKVPHLWPEEPSGPDNFHGHGRPFSCSSPDSFDVTATHHSYSAPQSSRVHYSDVSETIPPYWTRSGALGKDPSYSASSRTPNSPGISPSQPLLGIPSHDYFEKPQLHTPSRADSARLRDGSSLHPPEYSWSHGHWSRNPASAPTAAATAVRAGVAPRMEPRDAEPFLATHASSASAPRGRGSRGKRGRKPRSTETGRGDGWTKKPRKDYYADESEREAFLMHMNETQRTMWRSYSEELQREWYNHRLRRQLQKIARSYDVRQLAREAELSRAVEGSSPSEESFSSADHREHRIPHVQHPCSPPRPLQSSDHPGSLMGPIDTGGLVASAAASGCPPSMWNQDGNTNTPPAEAATSTRSSRTKVVELRRKQAQLTTEVNELRVLNDELQTQLNETVIRNESLTASPFFRSVGNLRDREITGLLSRKVAARASTKAQVDSTIRSYPIETARAFGVPASFPPRGICPPFDTVVREMGYVAIRHQTNQPDEQNMTDPSLGGHHGGLPSYEGEQGGRDNQDGVLPGVTRSEEVEVPMDDGECVGPGGVMGSSPVGGMGSGGKHMAIGRSGQRTKPARVPGKRARK